MELAIQDEMINQGKSVAQTGAEEVRTGHLRESREKAEREMQEIRENMRKENAANIERLLLAQERDVERLRKVTEGQNHTAQANAECFRHEREKVECDMPVEQMPVNSAANAAKSREAIIARKRELKAMKRQGEGQARAERACVVKFQANREKVKR